ncbi:MAG: RnfABCDGE type electron transport complex subunit B [Bacteroidota bacterium]|nr:RnfABCDGE type electron transport complex subunit B [Bacteroidota bacterium]MDX5404662.1 RnfABCDGE type electron transport complex subunit B [Bacteroidota bacterium]MDX5428004.1 RnfABCDGE type electron transport complex subunit B [Bacteroidota bacterium]MDX5448139.1 RnfABCDGE type electron transport complex subunit B [Bacteroidota bacterium]MDX5505845.1 RnfABCDGE type electron transport complex subunit B [Bacteroidota bacterium]
MPWNEIIIAIAILTGLGLLFSVILAVANIKLKVYEDPRIDRVEELLPGANCGACGMPGCRAFAEGVVKGELNPGKCTVSAPSGIERIADYLGVEASQEEKRVARVLCAGGKNEAHNRAHYRGTLSTCRGESVVAGGPKDCSWGCLGLGDCAEVCDFDAILMSEDALPVVDPEKCTACGDCVEICPKDLFTLMPVGQRLIVQCKSLLEGDLATDRCSVACNACGRCAADAPPGLIEIRDGLARVNYDLNHLAIPDATKRCPTGAIVWLEGEQQFALASEPELPLGRVDEPNYDQDTYYQ